jgi:hypothetical protein
MMTTPDEFLQRVLATVDDLAFRLSHTPHDGQEEWLQGFARRVHAQWCQVFSPALSANDVDGMVADLVARVRAKRDQLESFGGGTA